jgi:hypothetical protein
LEAAIISIARVILAVLFTPRIRRRMVRMFANLYLLKQLGIMEFLELLDSLD